MSYLYNHEQKEMADFIKRDISPSYFYRQELPNAKLNRHGWNYGQSCCFCEDKSGSLRIDLETGAFKCIACGVSGGDIIEFTITRYKIQMAEALAKLEFIYCLG
ncbi:MAG: CHC2 zinc finger domain-containing protein [Methylobacter sp.]|nr:CHC2 zinc finger domain-containing protein [Methylobacter sp.]